MPHARRYIKSNTCYEICFRARNTLPLVAYKVINLIIKSAIARTQRDNKVALCHHIWNGSHPHIIVVSKDAQQLVNFYSEIQKKITDAIKRLLGISHLELWEGKPMVAEIADLDKAKERISYLYANPAQDNLVEDIESFPGVSSWQQFKGSLSQLSVVDKTVVPWIRLPSIPRAQSSTLTHREDKALVKALKRANKQKHTLELCPNSWMSCFGVESDEQVQQINHDIIEMVASREGEARATRELEGKTVMGVVKLRSQPILKEHTPKKRQRKIFVLASCNKLRMQIIEQFKEFCAQCRNCYRSWLRGDYSVAWPPGAFKPPIPPNCNYISF